MTPEYILSKSLCRAPHCAGPYELRNVPPADWPRDALDSWRREAKNHIEYMEYASEYGEPGYGPAPKHGILFANWNYFPRGVDAILERAGYAIEWSDEWTQISETGKAYRTSPDGYGWKPSTVILDDCEQIGRDEIEDGTCIEQYIEHLLNEPRRCDTFDVDWTKHGFVKLNADAYESGLHPGQNDDPAKILAAAQAHDRESDFLFSLDSTRQFDASFSIWARNRETEES